MATHSVFFTWKNPMDPEEHGGHRVTKSRTRTESNLALALEGERNRYILIVQTAQNLRVE